ncbi:MAG: tetratricopeptide repeat protein [Acidobacteria bacterium]|nr:tetratricopeptide repeat protein [Acidobacteriota bacterium]
MENNRFELLTQMLEKKPKDSFARYGLAMEYVKQEEYAKAMEHFRKLWELHPDYSAAYFQGAQVLVKTGETEEARQVLTKGIEVAGRGGDLHIKGEMEAALEEL